MTQPDSSHGYRRLKERIEMGTQRWAAEHSATGAPVGIVLYDDDDDLFTVKTKDGEWIVYSRDRYEPLRDSDIDRDRGDQIVGMLEAKPQSPTYARPYG
jgi:hypothetical protein